MAYEEKRKGVWHAFDALDEQKTNQVQKSQLKVLTHNISSVLGVQKAEEALTDYHDTEHLNFKDYLCFLKAELFDKLEESSDDNVVNYNKIDDVCWLLCENKYLRRNPKIIDDNGTFKLWKMFNFLAETNSDGDPYYPLVMDCEEVEFLLQRLVQILGRVWNAERFGEFAGEILQFSFPQLLNLIETHYTDPKDSKGLVISVQDLYDEFIMDIIKKGFLQKKGHLVTNWKERWFVLAPNSLKYFSSRAEKEVKGEMSITNSIKVETLPEKSSSKSFRFAISCEGKNLEINSRDLRHQNEWMTAIQAAIDHVGSKEKFRKLEFLRRKKCRDEKRQRLEEEKRKRREEEEKNEQQRRELEEEKKARAELQAKMDLEAKQRAEELERQQKLDENMKLKQQQELEAEKKARAGLEAKLEAEAKERAEELERQRQLEEERKQKQQEELEAERKARAELEARLEEEALLREAEQQRLKELEELNRKLEELLETERQAKRDEEIVRQLQARLLEEEFAKREELEKLQIQQEELLAKEREEKQNLAEQKMEQEKILKVERQRLVILEEERKAADAQLQDAKEKLEKAEQLKREIQARKREREKPIGLARLIQPEPNPFITHRGVGAFSEFEFLPTRVRSLKQQREAQHVNANATSQEDTTNLDNTPAGDGKEKCATDSSENLLTGSNEKMLTQKMDECNVNGNSKDATLIDQDDVIGV